MSYMSLLLKRYRSDCLLILFVLTTNSLILLLFTRVIKHVSVNIQEFQGITSNYLAILISLFVATLIVATLFFYRLYLVASLSEKVSFDLRRIFFEKVLHLPPKSMEAIKSYGLPSIVTSDVMYAQTTLTSAVSSLYASTLVFIGALSVMIVSNLKYTLFFLMFVFLASIPLFLGGRLVKVRSSNNQLILSQLSNFLNQYVGRFKTVVSNNQHDKEMISFEGKIDQVRVSAIEKYKTLSIFSASIVVFLGISMFCMAAIIINDLVSETVSQSDVITFLFYMALCSGAIVNLVGLYGDIQTVSGAFSRIKNILDMPDTQDSGALNLENVHSLAFNDVFYQYQDASTPVLDNFSFMIGCGDAVVLTGRSGIGKSTIIDLITGIIEPDSGRILVSGIDLNKINRRSYIERVAVVYQQVDIIPGTILDNISYGVASFTQYDIDRVTEVSGAKRFISNLPEGYHTLIGEGNLKLSGGEAQMIAIARALIKKPDLLILDESTNAIDEKTELKILKNIKDELEGKILIHVTHKIKNMDMYTDVIRVQYKYS